MNDLDARLAECFSTIFPDLAEQEIPTATVDTVRGWDSLKTVMLISVIEEEFEVEVPIEQMETLTSFDRARHLVTEQLS
jgi:acyl carrier protein